MYQGGIKKIVLYENKNISFNHYDSNNLNAITDITNQGSIITILNHQFPEYEVKNKLSDSGQLTYEYSLKFNLYELSYDNEASLIILKTSAYGWCFLVEYYDGTYKFYNTPLICEESEINPQEQMTYMIQMETPVASLNSFFDYDPDVSTIPIYRADTTILTADTTIYTADYAL